MSDIKKESTVVPASINDEKNEALLSEEDTRAKLDSLAQAFEMFTKTTESLESSYQLLEERVKSLDAELQEKNRELALTTEYLNSILDSMSDGVVVLDPNRVITTFNRAAGDALGVDPAVAAGQTSEELLGKSFASQEGLQELDLIASDGKTVPVSTQSSPIADKEGTVTGTVTVFQDLRELESLRKQVRQRDRLAAIGEMAATVAHEIRNPLGGIQGFASLLARDLEEGSDQHRLVEKIVIGAKNLNRVVSDLLEYTRPLELEPARIDGKELIASAIAYCTLENNDIVIENRVPDSVDFRGDNHLLRQMFLNLLINASQSIDSAGTITIDVEENEGNWTFKVADSGAGIPEDEIGQVFTPFFTTKERGTGLGLAAAMKTVEAHGGSMRVESDPGHGTTFFVSLPKGV